MPLSSYARVAGASSLLLIVVACSNGRGSVGDSAPAEPSSEFSVAASIPGLEGSGLVLQNNGADDVEISGAGAATFATRLADGATYDITVLTQPSEPRQTCAVEDGSGTIDGSNVTIAVTCVTPRSETFFIRGTVSGLHGSGLVLQNNASDDLAIAADGEFAFATSLPSGAEYSVGVGTQPTNPSQTGSVANGAGIVGADDVTTVTVTCSTRTFVLGGEVSGLLGSGLELENNGVSLAIADNGTFAFQAPLAAGTPYSVRVKTPPSNPQQNCSVESATGTIEAGDVTNVRVTCMTDRFTIGGTISGLAGAGLVLETTGGGRFEATTNGPFQFPIAVASGTAYGVVVKKEPKTPSQTCDVAHDTGVVAGANVSDIEVTCVTNRYTIGGRVAGLAGRGLVLRVNGRNDLAIASNGAFIFDTVLASGTEYAITVASQPTNPAQTCTVANGTGAVESSQVSNVRVTCSTQTFGLSGTVTGLLGSGLVLQNNGQNPVEVATNGAFVFAELASGAAYDVTVRTQPSNPAQSCVVSGGSGTISDADVTTVSVTCSTSAFSIGGVVSGLSGSGLVLRNNGVDDLAVNANGAFSFATPLAGGGTYEVTVASQPANPTQSCTVANDTGTVGNTSVTSISVSCSTTEFTIGGTVTGLLGSGLTLQNNGGAALAIAANGPFTFPASVLAGTPYNVAVLNQPQNPAQTCAVSQSTGTATADVTNISVTCTTATFTIGGVVSGLAGTGGILLLQNNGGDDLIANDGAFTFATPVPSGSPFNVTIAAMPADRTCSITNGAGTVNDAAVTSVTVLCSPLLLPP
jgi:hypothetical protein